MGPALVSSRSKLVAKTPKPALGHLPAEVCSWVLKRRFLALDEHRSGSQPVQADAVSQGAPARSVSPSSSRAASDWDFDLLRVDDVPAAASEALIQARSSLPQPLVWSTPPPQAAA
mmetsp:Transcript_36411/g.96823  ORF Transcript_36411/g.96823 Transcript_36411/m.96823 type:complete len:116 (+) Transcript_36411:779-1126(+)